MSIYDEDWGHSVDTPRTISVEEQRLAGVTRAVKYVPANPSNAEILTASEQGLLSQAVQAASHLISHRQMSHLTRNEETPVQNAVASLIYSGAYAAIAALIAFILAGLAYLVIGGEEIYYFMLALLGWGIYVIRALRINREQGLEYSPAGLEHAEIVSREELAKFVITTHIDLIKERWKHKA